MYAKLIKNDFKTRIKLFFFQKLDCIYFPEDSNNSKKIDKIKVSLEPDGLDLDQSNRTVKKKVLKLTYNTKVIKI